MPCFRIKRESFVFNMIHMAYIASGYILVSRDTYADDLHCTKQNGAEAERHAAGERRRVVCVCVCEERRTSRCLGLGVEGEQVHHSTMEVRVAC